MYAMHWKRLIQKEPGAAIAPGPTFNGKSQPLEHWLARLTRAGGSRSPNDHLAPRRCRTG